MNSRIFPTVRSSRYGKESSRRPRILCSLIQKTRVSTPLLTQGMNTEAMFPIKMGQDIRWARYSLMGMNIAESSSTSAGGATTRSQVWTLCHLASCPIKKHRTQVQPKPGELSTLHRSGE